MMRRTCNKRRGIAATWCLAACLAAPGLAPRWAAAQQTRPDDPQADSSDESAARLPDAAAMRAAYATARGWIDAFEMPKMDNAASLINIHNASAVCVVLRRSGRVMGVGTDASGDSLMVRRAVGLALNEVLSDPALTSLSQRLRAEQQKNPDTALTVDALRADLGHSLTLELEAAGKFMPLVGRSLEQMSRTLEPGLDGLALRQRQSWNLAFPAQLRATNTGSDPSKLLLSLALQAGLPLRDLENLPNRPEVGLYRFRTLDLAQHAPDQPPFQTLRGDVLVAPTSVDQQAIRQLAEGLVNHLIASLWPDPPREFAESQTAKQPDSAAPAPPSRLRLGLLGDYSLVADQHRPLVAPPLDQALVAFALNHYARSLSGADAATAAAAAAAAARILSDLADVTTGEDDPRADPAACALLIYALTEAPDLRGETALEGLFNDAAKRVRGCFDAESGFVERAADGGPGRILPPPVQAMIAGAMARLLVMVRAEDVGLDASTVRHAIDAAWQSVPQPRQVALLPWIGWAESDLALASKQPPGHLDELRLLLDVLDESRIGSPSHPSIADAPDLDGGFALTASSPGAASQATAQTVRPAAWLATALRDPTLMPPAKAPAALQRHLQTMRFLIQLSVRETSAGSIQNPVRALGGIRAALWDSNQPVPAQALGLLTATETLITLDRLGNRTGP